MRRFLLTVGLCWMVASGLFTRAQAMTVQEAKVTPLRNAVTLTDKVVTGVYPYQRLGPGTDQWTGNFFYIQDDSGGIRVRSTASVQAGDLVTITGTMNRTSDNAIYVKRNGEKEITASSVQVTGTGTLPKLVGMTNGSTGGGAWRPGFLDADGFPSQPAVFKKFSGSTTVSEDGLSNAGRMGYFWGAVVQNNTAGSAFVIDDGSQVVFRGAKVPSTPTDAQYGVYVLVYGHSNPITGIEGKFVRVTGVVGSISISNITPSTGIANLRIVRLWEEPFVDSNGNGLRDPGEPYTDLNGNGQYDGLIVMN